MLKLVFLVILVLGKHAGVSAQSIAGMQEQELEKLVKRAMSKGDIPGLSLVLVADGKTIIKNYGYSDVRRKIPVSSGTLFQLGSCSKAFTALAMQQLAAERNISLDTMVSACLPWFNATYKDKPVPITIRQLLNHTSGIPWKTLSDIPERDDADALEQTVRKISGIKLHHLPGKEFEYATINYDIVALIIQTITGTAFEQYIQQNIFQQLSLAHTSIGKPWNGELMSKGYKISFMKAREYNAPVFRGNNAAGYIISDAADMAKWLEFQMGIQNKNLFALARETQLRDETVAPAGLSSYAMGWQVSLRGDGVISHTGENPNFTTYAAFQPKKGWGVVVLTNSASNFTFYLGNKIMRLMAGDNSKDLVEPDSGADKVFTLVSLVLAIYTLLIFVFLAVVTIGIVTGKRRFRMPDAKGWRSLVLSLLLIAFLLFGLYLLPGTLGFSWQAVKVWSPVSFFTMVVLITAALGISFAGYCLSWLFPGAYHFKKEIPGIVLASILSGIANMGIILLITSSLKDSVSIKYMLFYFSLLLVVYLLGRRYVQISLIRITREIIFDVRVKLVEKIFSTSYEKFEKIDKGRVYATLNDDVNTVGNAANMIVSLVSSTITAGGVFLYLATLELWATLLTIGLIVAMSLIYTSITRRTQQYFEKARDAQNFFLRLVGGIIDGFKELSLRRNKKLEYRDDVAKIAGEYNEKTSLAQRKFLHASLLGELSLMILLGTAAFGISELFPGIEQYKVTNFVILVLYLNGPLNIILNSVPGIMQLKIAWNRIHTFINEIPANLNLETPSRPLKKEQVQSIRAEGIAYRYGNENGKDGFSVGPVNLEVKRGQILFIIGGNGSGKTTLAKLITGLYTPSEGKMFINDKEVGSGELIEYFSAIFSPCYLFEKLYDVNTTERAEEINRYLHLLGLTDKVEIKDGCYSTINLSSGQRKRLAMLQSYLDDSPICLFDEWAADQDPEYRNFFYRKLLPDMKKKGKIIIAITHDDHFFDVADKILKMDLGKTEYVSDGYKVDELLSR